MTSSNQQVGTTYAEYSGWSGRGTLLDLSKELQRQLATKKDYVADTRNITVAKGKDDEPVLMLAFGEGEDTFEGQFDMTRHALGQLAGRCQVPVPGKFIHNLWASQPETARELLNSQNTRRPKKELLRTLDGKCRAVLSSKYRCIDNYDLAEVAMRLAKERNLRLLEGTLNDSHMRLKFTAPDVVEAIDEARTNREGWYARGLGSQEMLSRVAATRENGYEGGGHDPLSSPDPGQVHPLVTISNSETGQGGLHVRSGILRAACFNLATVETIASKTHLGGTLGLGELTAQTIALKNRALVAELGDHLGAVFNPAKFRELCARIQGAADTEVAATTEAVQNVIKLCELNEGHQEGILASLLQEYSEAGRSNVYGLAQAVSGYSQTVEDATQAECLEDAAGEMLLKPKKFAIAAS